MEEARATYCFCGCGTRVKHPRLVVTNTNGWELSEELAEWTKLDLIWSYGGMEPSGELPANIEQGQHLWAELREAIHAGQRADKEDEKRAVVWRKRAKKARRRVRKRMRRDGIADPFELPGLESSELTAWLTEGQAPQGWADVIPEVAREVDALAGEVGADVLGMDEARSRPSGDPPDNEPSVVEESSPPAEAGTGAEAEQLPYECPICGRGFETEEGLGIHYDYRHPEAPDP